jgi:hypothetical protein
MRVCRGNGAVQIAVRKRVSGRVALLPYGQVTAVPRTRQYVRTKRSMLAADHGRGMFRVRSGRQGCDGLVASGTEERVAKLMRRLDAASGVREQTGERASRMPAGYFLGAAQIWAQSVLCRASFPSSPAFDIIPVLRIRRRRDINIDVRPPDTAKVVLQLSHVFSSPSSKYPKCMCLRRSIQAQGRDTGRT